MNKWAQNLIEDIPAQLAMIESELITALLNVEPVRRNPTSDAYNRLNKLNSMRLEFISTISIAVKRCKDIANNAINPEYDGYDLDGYDLDGYDRAGFDRDGYDQAGFAPRWLSPRWLQ